MAFTLNDTTLGVLGGGQFKTVAFDMAGSFREIQFQFTQAVANQDAEIHFLEFHYLPVGVSHEDV